MQKPGATSSFNDHPVLFLSLGLCLFSGDPILPLKHSVLWAQPRISAFSASSSASLADQLPPRPITDLGILRLPDAEPGPAPLLLLPQTRVFSSDSESFHVPPLWVFLFSNFHASILHLTIRFVCPLPFWNYDFMSVWFCDLHHSECDWKWLINMSLLKS